MADDFFYRADPPENLAGDDIAALAKLQEQCGLSVATPGHPLTPEEMKTGPHEAIERSGADLERAKEGLIPVKLCLPLPGLNGLDPMLLGGLIGNLISDGAKILEFDGRTLSDPAVDLGDDGFTLAGLLRPDGFRLAVHLGALSAWTPERLTEVTEELAADRYVFETAPGADYSVLSALPEEALAVLGLVDASGQIDADAVLDALDAIDEILGQDRMALTATGPITDAAVQKEVLTQIADISVRFFGFAA
ncbi:MAG: hypothetical protein ACK5IB_11740 [Qingshengfaniella sp.]